MSTDARIEGLAEAIVFGHDVATKLPAAGDPDAAALERVAALAAAALAPPAPVPASLQAALATAALRHCAALPAHATDSTAGKVDTAAPRRGSGVLPFLVGLAAGLTLWLLGWSLVATQPPARERRAALLAAAAADVQWRWQAGPSPLRGEVAGDVVWSHARQEGYLSFRGLPPLDAEHCFQLWIVDGRRDGAPVDGGLFAVADATGETVVPVRAALTIAEPAAFVVTVEDRRGVVVSKQEHVVALARP